MRASYTLILAYWRKNRVQHAILLLWLCFLVRGTFYCATLPLWEGWDEYAHFAVLQHWTDFGTMPRSSDGISREVDESMRLGPLANELRWIGPPYLTHGQWWAQPAAERGRRIAGLASIPAAHAHQPAQHPFASYESQQPPLYYWLMTVPFRLASPLPLTSRALLLRWLSMTLASVAVPLTGVAVTHKFRGGSALYCAALLAVAPGFAIDASRIANDSLAIALAALFLCLLMRRPAGWLAVGLTLGAALLTKAYLLALLPVAVICYWKDKRRLIQILAVALTIGGWWYARNAAHGIGLSGWDQDTGGHHPFSGITRIDWIASADIIAKSFIWFGGWSFLTLKSWIYRVIEVITVAGVIAFLFRRKNDLWIPGVISGCFLAAVVYGVLSYNRAQGIPNLPGWYLWPVAGSFAAILTRGLGRISVLLILLLAAVDLYGVAAVLTPYYSGLVDWNRVDASRFLTALGRLGVSLPLTVAWMAATIAVPFIAFQARVLQAADKP